MFEFLDAQVNREARVDCALAELYTKSLATERSLDEQKHAEVLTKLYVRMNEVSRTTNSHGSLCLSSSAAVIKGTYRMHETAATITITITRVSGCAQHH